MRMYWHPEALVTGPAAHAKLHGACAEPTTIATGKKCHFIGADKLIV